MIQHAGMAALDERVGAINDVLCALALLIWDSRTMMPPGSAVTRGQQIATLTRLARDMLMADETRRALEAAENAAQTLEPDNSARRNVAHVRHAMDFHSRIPASLIEARAAQRALANAAWIEARAKSDFSLFAPHLENTVALAREYAAAIGVGSHANAHPYDALIGLYEPGETLVGLKALFGQLRSGIAPVFSRVLAKPKPRTDFLHRHFPLDGQRALALSLIGRFGYALDHGRLDTTVHPFEISLTRDDVRITTRYREDFLPPALFGAFHEAGHGMYEQNVDEAYTRTALATDLAGLYAVGGTSFGAHESQSRLWENHVGRSRRFWDLHFAEARHRFPEALADVDAETFHAGVTAVSPGFIRTEADELTYDLHIMLRVELEAALISGDLAVADIPAAWNAAMKQDLGLDVPDDARGCLQDIHWSSGMIGSFCTYTIGNVMAAQLFEAATQDDENIGFALARGDYAPLHGWLRHAIWQHGRRFSRDELLMRATGKKLSAGPYLAYLARRYGA